MPGLKSALRELFRHVMLSSLILLAFETDVQASASNICDDAAVIAAKKTSVPLSVLLAVTRTETGRSQGAELRPWPWAINAGGEGSWLPSKTVAERTIKKYLERGKKNIDVGCFQLNFRWHGHAFSSISQMLDPEKNAIYAANFLSRLFSEKGDWTKAVGAFHSRTSRFSDLYIKKYSAIYAALQDNRPLRRPPLSPIQQPNHFPLLKPSDVTPLRGSLVPLDSTTNRLSLISRNGET